MEWCFQNVLDQLKGKLQAEPSVASQVAIFDTIAELGSDGSQRHYKFAARARGIRTGANYEGNKLTAKTTSENVSYEAKKPLS